MLKNWRTRQKLTLAQAASFIGLKSRSQLFYIENGTTFPLPEAIGKIETATGGTITVIDHWRAWVKAHPTEVSQFRAAARHAAREHRPPGKSKSKLRRV